jgi:hypothetical protein
VREELAEDVHQLWVVGQQITRMLHHLIDTNPTEKRGEEKLCRKWCVQDETYWCCPSLAKRVAISWYTPGWRS